MGNTGNVIVLTRINNHKVPPVEEDNVPCGPADPPDCVYFPDYPDPVACPIAYSFACPVSIIATAIGSGKMNFEFSLPNAVVLHSVIKKVKVTATGGTATSPAIIFTLPHTPANFFSGQFTGLAAGTYTINVQYCDAAGNQISTPGNVTCYDPATHVVT